MNLSWRFRRELSDGFSLLALLLFVCLAGTACSPNDDEGASPAPPSAIKEIDHPFFYRVEADKTMGVEGCAVLAEFRRALPSEDDGERVRGVGGKYEILSSSTSSELAFENDYVSQYAKHIEENVVAIARQDLCGSAKEKIKLQITFIELSFFQPFDLEEIPRYGRVEYDELENILYGVFVWNPRQILADQYMLHTRKYPVDELSQISLSQFNTWAAIYQQFLVGSPSREISRELAAIPEDILWLFEVSPQVTRVSFLGLARATLESVISGSEPGYSVVATELIKFKLQPGSEMSDPDLSDLFFPARIYELSEIYAYP